MRDSTRLQYLDVTVYTMITLERRRSTPPAAAAVRLQNKARRLPPTFAPVEWFAYSHNLEHERSLAGPRFARPRGPMYGPPVPPHVTGGAFSNPAPTRPVPHAPGPAVWPRCYAMSQVRAGAG